MKHILAPIAFAATFLVDYLIEEFPSLPPRFNYMPDLVMGLVAMVVIARLVANQRIFAIPLKYVFVFLAYCYVAIAGTMINDVSAAVTFAGIRTYFKYVPIFLIPFAYEFSPSDVRKQLLVILVLGFLQVPISAWQRFFKYPAWVQGSGDAVGGTFATGGSGTLSIFLVSVIVMVIAFFLGRRISARTTAVTCLLLFLPTTINETKATPVFLLIGGLGLAYAMRRTLDFRKSFAIGAAALSMFVAFVVVYDQLWAYQGQGYVELMTSKEQMERYNSYGVEIESIRSLRDRPQLVAKSARITEQNKPVARGDALKMPFQAFLPDDFTHLLFGVGIGNVTSTFGDGGKYRFVAERFGGSSSTVVQSLWECGALGTLLYLLYIFLVWKDALLLANDDSPWSDFASGWAAVCLVVLLVCFYQSTLVSPALPTVFAFFSGTVAATCRDRRRAPAWPVAISSIR